MQSTERFDTLLHKGVAEILPSTAALSERLASGKPLTVYCGFDPTAPTLHIGHGTQLRKLRQFQDLGHQVIFLIGDFTARIGDPTDKSAARRQLTVAEIKKNLKAYKTQAGKFIRFSGKNAAKVKFNGRWLGKMKFDDVIELASLMTVDQMLKRDMFARRLAEEKPIYIHEFLYPLMQGYDSVALDVDAEVGGNDQLFNMMTGRMLQKALRNKEKFVITLKLLEDGSGKKMSKSEGNMVALDDAPEDMFGKIMSWPDGLIVPAFELCTDVSPRELEEIASALASGENPRDLKLRLAHAITAIATDDALASRARDSFIRLFQKREATDDIKEVAINGRMLETILLEEGLAESKGALRRLFEGNAVTDFETKEALSVSQAKLLAVPGVYKVGKSRFIKLTN